MAGELNTQLQQLASRMTNVENGLVAHHLALSQVTAALLANPYTMDVGMVGVVFYNFMPASFQILMDLVGSGIPSFSSLMASLAQSLMNEVEQAVEDLIDGMIEQVEQMIKQLTAMLDDILKQIEDINKKIVQLENDLAKTLDASSREAKIKEIEQANKDKVKAEVSYKTVQDKLTNFKQMTPTDIEKVAEFILGQLRLKQGKSSSITFDGM